MRRLLWLVVLLSIPARAQGDDLFGSGKPPVYREEAMDRKFTRSRLAKLLKSGTNDPACVELLGGLLVALAEIAPSFDKANQDFYLHPALVGAVQTQLSTPRFPAMAYLVSMVRRVLIDGRLSDEWMATAVALNAKVKIIDLAKLKMLNEQLSPIDSFRFTIPLLHDRYVTEALGANSAVTSDVVAAFRDKYLDRDVSWGGATLVDIGINQPKGKGKRRYAAAEPEELVAILQWTPPDVRSRELDLMGTSRSPKGEPITLYVRLQPKQYTDVEKVYRGQRVLVKGRFWEMNRTLSQIEIRDGLLFNDNDWDRGVVLGSPADIAQCPAALNDLTGIAPNQPSGFGH